MPIIVLMTIVVFLVMITIMIVPALGIAVGRCQRAALQPPGKKEQSDGEQAAAARAIVCEIVAFNCPRV
jgi:hypothetical protein